MFSQANTDIWLLRIDRQGEKIHLTQPQNITARAGYDNQPVFSPDSKKIYFSSMAEGTKQTDIYFYDLEKKQIEAFNFSKTSEFSPSFMPGLHGISVVMVEEDSTQRIWEFDLTGKRSRLVFANNDSVGYYAWVNSNSAIAFILGNNSAKPNRLSLITRDGREKLIAENVARGMKVFEKSAFYLKTIDSSCYVFHTDFSTSRQLVKAPGKSVDMSVLGDNLLMAYKGIIYAAKIETNNKLVKTLSEFSPIADLSGYGLTNMARLSVSPDGRWLAVVNAE
jgi:hypothetical protein